MDGSFDGSVNLTALNIAEDNGADSGATVGITDDITHSSSGDSKQRVVAKTRTSTGRTRGSISVSVDEIDGNLLPNVDCICMYVCVCMCAWYV